MAKGLPKQGERDQHHAPLPYAEVPVFLSRLRASDQREVTKLAFEFLTLTAARTSEVLSAEWREIDEVEALWIVPAGRMKAKPEHRAPLSKRAQEILQRARMLSGGSQLLFPGRSGTKPLSNMVFLMALGRIELPITAHGFRSSFRDWAAEASSFPREVAEAALAHTIESKVEAAYRRSDLLAKRREMMESWSSHCE